MQKFTTSSTLRQTMFMIGLVVALGLTGPKTATAQELDQNMSSQLLKLEEQVARLEAALNQNSNRTPSDTPAEGGQAGTEDSQGTQDSQDSKGTQGTAIKGVRPGFRIKADYQNCLQCHQTRPTSPLPPDHLEKMTTSAPAGQTAPGAESGAKQGTQTKSGGMGKGMMGGEGGMGKGMMGGGMGKGMMGGGMGKGMMGGEGGMGDGSTGMGGGQAAMGASTAGTMDRKMQQMQQQMDQMQQQMQQMMQMQMLQMRLMEMQLKKMD